MEDRPDHLYRYDAAKRYDRMTGQMVWRPLLRTIPVEKHTEKGCWINDDGERRFVLLAAGKAYAYADQQRALISFIKRKQAQLRILAHQRSIAETTLEIALSELPNEEQHVQRGTHTRTIAGLRLNRDWELV